MRKWHNVHIMDVQTLKYVLWFFLLWIFFEQNLKRKKTRYIWKTTGCKTTMETNIYKYTSTIQQCVFLKTFLKFKSSVGGYNVITVCYHCITVLMTYPLPVTQMTSSTAVPWTYTSPHRYKDDFYWCLTLSEGGCLNGTATQGRKKTWALTTLLVLKTRPLVVTQFTNWKEFYYRFLVHGGNVSQVYTVAGETGLALAGKD